MKYYAGIGARDTPVDILRLMTKIATYLNGHGYTLRSGGAYGADTAFATGCRDKQIFVPWDGYNNLKLEYSIPNQAFNLAADLHPSWKYLTHGVIHLMARNCMQILGPELNDPSQFVICWTKDGCNRERDRTPLTGGTGQAIALASRNNIPIYNLKREEHYERFSFLLKDES